MNTFGTAMLGLTLECARCHDHKFDPITQRDYYSLFAFFNSIDESGLYSHFTNATPSPSLLLWPGSAAKQHDLLRARIAAAEAGLAAISRAARAPFKSWARDLDRPERDRCREPARADRPPRAQCPSTATRRRTACRRPSPRFRTGWSLVRDQPGLDGFNAALVFSGDSAVVHPGVRPFVRTDTFSFSLRLKPTATQDRAVILHQSRAWSDAGSRGFELTLDRGTPVLRA